MLDGCRNTAVADREAAVIASGADHYAPPCRQRDRPYELALVRAILDRRPYPVFVMDAALVIYLKNLETDKRSAAYGLSVVEGRKLSLFEADTASRLKRLTRTMASNTDARYACEVFTYELPDGHGATLSLSRVEALDNEDGGIPAVLFVVSARKNLGAVEICANRLMATFGLTKAEANLCAALAQNVALPDYALREGIKVSTVRWHLQNVYERCGVNSQTELIAMMVSVLL